jgi:hypothetical protein
MTLVSQNLYVRDVAAIGNKVMDQEKMDTKNTSNNE